MVNLLTSLGLEKNSIGRAIDKLESLSHFPAEDVRLLQNIKRYSACKVASLGLDPADTTAEELHHSLINRLSIDGDHLARALAIRKDEGFDKAFAKISHVFKSLSTEKSLIIKPAVAKKILRANPPKHLMKQLGYRSSESMLKRENPAAIFAGAMKAEPNTWKRSVAKSLSKLNSSDFEERQLQLLSMGSKWSVLADTHQPVTNLALFGAVFLWDTPAATDPKALFCLPLIAEAVQFVESDSGYLRNHLFSADLGHIAEDIFLGKDYKSIDLNGSSDFDWAHLHAAVNQHDSFTDRLASLHPLFNWWRSAANLGYLDQAGNFVSMNINDCVRSAIADESYVGRYFASWVHQIKAELINTYSQHLTAKNYLQGLIDDTFIELEPVYEPVTELENQSIQRVA